MVKYHKIQSMYKRKENGNIIRGEYAIPEFDYLKNNICEWVEKVDGTNIRIILDQKTLYIRGKSDRAEIPIFLMAALRNTFTEKLLLETFDEALDVPVCLYGEGYGQKIQKGSKYRNDNGFVLFDVKIGNTWMDRQTKESIAKDLKIDIVPVVGKGTLIEAADFVRNGFTSAWGDFIAEGLVMRPVVDLLNRKSNRIITKIKYKDFN